MKAREKAMAQVAAERDGLTREKGAIVKEHETALAALRADAGRKAAEIKAALAEKEAKIAELNSEHERTLGESVKAQEQAGCSVCARRALHGSGSG